MSAQELGLTWDESDETPGQNTHASASVGTSFLWDRPSRNPSFFPDGEDLLAQVRTLLRPDTTTFPSVSANSDPGGLNLPEQERADQGRLVQAITQWLQTRPNLVLILNNAETVVIVAAKENGC